MTDLYLRRTLSGFVPADEASLELMKRFKVGQAYRGDVVKPRSYQHHKLCMALLNLTYEHKPEDWDDRYPDFDSFRYAVARSAGHRIEFVDLDTGEIVQQAKSISYDAIPDDVEFGRVMAAMMRVCAKILAMSEPDLEQEVARYADEHYGAAA